MAHAMPDIWLLVAGMPGQADGVVQPVICQHDGAVE